MIINKVQRTENNLKYIDISYVLPDGQIHVFSLNVGTEDMYEWAYAPSPSMAEPDYKSFDNKKVYKKYFLNGFKVFCGFIC